MNPTAVELINTIDSTWEEFDSYLAKLTDNEMTGLVDEQGWSIRDHLSHLLGWEKAFLLVFDGIPRYQTLGIELTQAKAEFMDEINEKIREQWQTLSVQSIFGEYRNNHNLLAEKVKCLSDNELDQTVSDYFPHEVPTYNRKVVNIIQDHMVHHVVEHLGWIKSLMS